MLSSGIVIDLLGVFRNDGVGANVIASAVSLVAADVGV